MPTSDPPKKPGQNGAAPSFETRLVLVLVLAVVAVVMWSAPLVPFLVLAAVLVALALDGTGQLLRRMFGRILRRDVPRWSTIIMAVMIFSGASTALVAFLGPEISGQAQLIKDKLPDAVAELRAELAQYGIGRAILKETPTATETEEVLNGGPPPEDVAPPEDAEPGFAGAATEDEPKTGDDAAEDAEDEDGKPADKRGVDIEFGSIFTSTFGFLADLILVIVLGLYLVASPREYMRGIVRLVPLAHRERARALLAELELLLKRWLAGRLIAMVVVTLMIWPGLVLVGVPFALSLAILAGALSFIPTIGPIVGTVPGVLLALLEGGPPMALGAGGFYLVAHLLEGYLVTPQVDKRAVRIPPALLLLAQVVVGLLFGVIGLLLATPLTVIVTVLVRRLYVEGALGDTQAAVADGPAIERTERSVRVRADRKGRWRERGTSGLSRRRAGARPLRVREHDRT